MGNFIKATFTSISSTYGFLTPDLWQIIPPGASPFEENSAHCKFTLDVYPREFLLIHFQFILSVAISGKKNY